MIPNALAGVFNYTYNYQSIIRALNADEAFRIVQQTINAIAFPLGLIVGLFLVVRIGRVVKSHCRRDVNSPADRHDRHAALRLGNRLAWLGIIEWGVAGIAYPASIAALGVPMTRTDCLHFFGSLLMCGLIAAAYPFFGATAIVVGSWYPRLLSPGVVPIDDVACLKRLESQSYRYLVLAGIIPLLAIVILTTWGRAENILALKVLSVGGLVLFGVTLLLARQIQTHVRELIGLAANR